MRVLHINAVYRDGSTGVIVEDLHNIAQSNDIESYVAYSTSTIPQCDIPNGYQIGNKFGKKLHALFCRINGMQGYFSRFATRKLLRYITKISPDIVHLHNLHSNYIHLNMLLKYLANNGIKTVVTLHDCWFYTGGCFHYTAAGCDKWQKECGNCPKKLQDTPAYLFERSAKILKERKKYFSAINDLTVVGVSNWITEEATKTVFKNSKALTIYNGIDTEIFKPTESDFRKKHNLENKFVILGPASKWLSQVNKETFDSVVSSLKVDESLVLLGCSQNKMGELPNKVIGLPFVKDKTELSKIYSAADVFVNPTREESLSLINIEAQACGTPVITYSNTGVKETVDNICGFSVKTGDFLELIDKIQYVKSIGKQSLVLDTQKRIVQNFDKNENYKNYINLYKSGELNDIHTCS